MCERYHGGGIHFDAAASQLSFCSNINMKRPVGMPHGACNVECRWSGPWVWIIRKASQSVSGTSKPQLPDDHGYTAQNCTPDALRVDKVLLTETNSKAKFKLCIQTAFLDTSRKQVNEYCQPRIA